MLPKNANIEGVKIVNTPPITEVVKPGGQLVVVTASGQDYTPTGYEKYPPGNEGTPVPIETPKDDTTPTQQLFDAPQQVDNFVAQHPQLKRISNTPTASWINSIEDVQRKVLPYSLAAKDLSQVPVFVLYNAIARNPEAGIDGSVSDGAGTTGNYKIFIDSVIDNVKTESIFILEPDATALEIVLSQNHEALAYAVDRLSEAGHKVYVDTSHAQWRSPEDMANAVEQFIGNATGISVNVSNYGTTEDNVAYGKRILELLSAKGIHGKTMVVDTSRNGNGQSDHPDNWCNARNAALGNTPTLDTGIAGVDAFLWIKPPGESDGYCNDGMAAGLFDVNYALGLIERARN